MIHLDTNVVVRLWRDPAAIPNSVLRRLEAEEVAISPMVELELEYLAEVGRLATTPAEVLGGLSPALGLDVSSASFARVVEAAKSLTWTRDPFDRLIAANAITDGAALLTLDRTIRANLSRAVWDDA